MFERSWTNGTILEAVGLMTRWRDAILPKRRKLCLFFLQGFDHMFTEDGQELECARGLVSITIYSTMEQETNLEHMS